MAPSQTNSWDIKAFVMDEGNGVKGLADMGLKALPKQYVQPPRERVDMSRVVSEDSIPIVSVSEWDDPRVAESICDAAERWGFFQIVNHGVPLGVLEDVKCAAHRFFALPAEEKKKYLKEYSATNNVRFGTSFAPHEERALEWKDYLSLFYVSDQEAFAFWPSTCRDQVLKYMKESESVIQKLLEVLMKRLNANILDEALKPILMGSNRVNLNYYPRCPNPELTVGVGRHSDVSTLTVLLQDEIGGLYVRKLESDCWIHVPPISGSLVINIGDALQIMSNGRYKSVEHRVAANGSKDRVSIPIFVNPRPRDVIGPLPEVLEGGEKALYKRVIYSDYVKHFFRKAHDGKDTIDLALIK